MKEIESFQEKICIVTDSTCDLPADVLQALDIHVVPCYVNMNGTSFMDGVEISRSDFYQQLPELSNPATTSAPGVGLFEEMYRSLIQGGAKKILSIHVTSKLSSVVDTARLAAQSVRENIVEVIDSGQVSLGLGYLVEEAAKAARAGMESMKISSLIREKVNKVFLYAVLDTLEYLRRSGRISSLKSGLGNLMQIHPIIIVHQGEVLVEMVRTKQKAIQKVREKINYLGVLSRMSVVHGHAIDSAREIIKGMEQFLPKNNGSLYYSEITPAIGVHVGPKAVGIICVQD
jgi:DegV family protein with EDD domain